MAAQQSAEQFKIFSRIFRDVRSLRWRQPGRRQQNLHTFSGHETLKEPNPKTGEEIPVVGLGQPKTFNYTLDGIRLPISIQFIREYSGDDLLPSLNFEIEKLKGKDLPDRAFPFLDKEFREWSMKFVQGEFDEPKLVSLTLQGLGSPFTVPDLIPRFSIEGIVLMDDLLVQKERIIAIPGLNDKDLQVLATLLNLIEVRYQRRRLRDQAKQKLDGPLGEDEWRKLRDIVNKIDDLSADILSLRVY